MCEHSSSLNWVSWRLLTSRLTMGRYYVARPSYYRRVVAVAVRLLLSAPCTGVPLVRRMGPTRFRLVAPEGRRASRAVWFWREELNCRAMFLAILYGTETRPCGVANQLCVKTVIIVLFLKKTKYNSEKLAKITCQVFITIKHLSGWHIYQVLSRQPGHSSVAAFFGRIQNL